MEIASAAKSSSSSAACSSSSGTTGEQNEDDELYAHQAQSDEVQQVLTMFTKLSLFSPSAALQESDNPSIRQSAEAISVSLKETEKSISCEAARGYPLSEPGFEIASPDLDQELNKEASCTP